MRTNSLPDDLPEGQLDLGMVLISTAFLVLFPAATRTRVVSANFGFCTANWQWHPGEKRFWNPRGFLSIRELAILVEARHHAISSTTSVMSVYFSFIHCKQLSLPRACQASMSSQLIMPGEINSSSHALRRSSINSPGHRSVQRQANASHASLGVRSSF